MNYTRVVIAAGLAQAVVPLLLALLFSFRSFDVVYLSARLIGAFPCVVPLLAVYIVGNVLLRVVNCSTLDFVLCSAVLREVACYSARIAYRLPAAGLRSLLEVVDFHRVRVAGARAESSNVGSVA